MKMEDVPEELLLDAVDRWHEAPGYDLQDRLAYVLADVLPKWDELQRKKPLRPGEWRKYLVLQEEKQRAVRKQIDDLKQAADVALSFIRMLMERLEKES